MFQSKWIKIFFFSWRGGGGDGSSYLTSFILNVIFFIIFFVSNRLFFQHIKINKLFYFRNSQDGSPLRPWIRGKSWTKGEKKTSPPTPSSCTPTRSCLCLNLLLLFSCQLKFSFYFDNQTIVWRWPEYIYFVMTDIKRLIIVFIVIIFPSTKESNYDKN